MQYRFEWLNNVISFPKMHISLDTTKRLPQTIYQ